MMGVFARGKTLWIRYRDVDGKWRSESTGCGLDEESKAQKALDKIEAHLRATRTPSTLAGASTSANTVRAFAGKWMKERDTGTKNDDQGRLDNQILPALGHIPIAELRPRHVRDFVEKLKVTKKQRQMRKDGTLVGEEENIAPRTVLHIYGTLRSMLNDAVADEVIASSPCVLKDELPEKKDKDRTWRRTAVFTRDEVQTVISASSSKIPDDRREMYAIMFLGAMRFGEAAALTWRDYDAAATPLGKIVVEKSYSSKQKRVKETKTDNPREMPVHPTLAKILATWKLGGRERTYGKAPKDGDLIVRTRRAGQQYKAADTQVRFVEDLAKLGLRTKASTPNRRGHDLRRTLITLARADGAIDSLLRWVTHGPRPSEILDVFSSPPWAELCREISKLRIRLLDGGGPATRGLWSKRGPARASWRSER